MRFADVQALVGVEVNEALFVSRGPKDTYFLDLLRCSQPQLYRQAMLTPPALQAAHLAAHRYHFAFYLYHRDNAGTNG